MSKSRKQILQELLDLENSKTGDLGERSKSENDAAENEKAEAKNDTEDAHSEPITKPKKKLTAKQLETLKRGQQIRDENARLRKQAAEAKAAEEKKRIEEKIVKKAIAIKKKEIKRQAALDEISDDETPIEKIKEIAAAKKEQGTNGSPATPPSPEPIAPIRTGPIIRFF